jgi:hypothetical protein
MASEIHLRLYEELNDFLPPDQRKRRFSRQLEGITTVKELLASLGVPCDQVELVLINGRSVDFSCLLQNGDAVSIYPVFESMDVKPLVRVRSKPLRENRFMVDSGMHRLAAYLRLCGFDALESGSWADEEKIRVSEEERRILLTRDPALLKDGRLSRIFLVKKTKPRHQLIEVLSRFHLYGTFMRALINRVLTELHIIR